MPWTLTAWLVDRIAQAAKWQERGEEIWDIWKDEKGKPQNSLRSAILEPVLQCLHSLCQSLTSWSTTLANRWQQHLWNFGVLRHSLQWTISVLIFHTWTNAYPCSSKCIIWVTCNYVDTCLYSIHMYTYIYIIQQSYCMCIRRNERNSVLHNYRFWTQVPPQGQRPQGSNGGSLPVPGHKRHKLHCFAPKLGRNAARPGSASVTNRYINI